MVFTKRLREGIRRGRIRTTIRIWQRLHVRVGGRYPMDEGHVVVDSIERMKRSQISDALARESGFTNAKDLIQTASHGPGRNVYLIRFRYLPAGAWEAGTPTPPKDSAALLQRIRRSAPPARKKNGRRNDCS